jgi:GABA permease
MICLSQLKLRRKWVEEGSLKFAMWGHPWLPLLVTASIVAVLVSMAFDPSMQISLLQCLIAIAAIAASYALVRLSRCRRQAGVLPARSAS